jgi:hypothetical protein
MTSCREFERWLDDGMPAAGQEVARDHATMCGACARLLGVAERLDGALAMSTPPAPAGFADAVMARILAPAPKPVRVRGTLVDPLPWWLRAAAEPATVLALTLAAVVTWAREWLWSLGTAVLVAWGTPARPVAPQAMPPWERVLADPIVQSGLWWGVLPIVVLAGLVLFDWMRRWASSPSVARAQGRH